MSRVPWEWKPFAKSLPFQPAPAFLLLGLLAKTIARTTPWLLHASCEGAARATLAAVGLFVYITVGIPLACAAYYLGFARRRIAPSHPRMIADLSFISVLIVSAVNLAMLGRGLVLRWTALQPALAALRHACWQ